MAVVREDVVQLGFDIDFRELSKLTDELDDIKKAFTGGIGDDAFDEMIKDSKKAASGVDDIKDSLRGVKPGGIEDTVKELKNTDRQAEDAHKELKKIANTGFDKTVSGLKKVSGTLGTIGIQAGKVLAKGIAVGAAGVGAIVYKSVMNYADYEQLVGGVDTLFKDSSGTVQKYADDAYKTAGLSANDYMSTVTSFSASLIQSLGGNTGKAAELANMAIIDMSDNANKMGTDMGAIQDAYQGFAKQNYTMLDNLKLGYGGTQEEMKRLLKDAQAISGVKYDIKSYADVVEAIHVIQKNMGIAGTTAKEASETISGSFASLKGAWSNTLTSLILGGDDFDRCVENLVDSAKTFGKNIMPAILKGLTGVGKLIEEMAPIISRELPEIIDALLPPLIKAATELVKGLIIALPGIIRTLVDEIPGVLKQVWSGFKEAFGEIPGMEKAEAFFNKLIGFIQDNTDKIRKLVPAVLGLVFAFKIFNKIKGITNLFGGGAGRMGGGFFSSFATMNPKTALKGMLNIGIVLAGLGALAAIVMWVAPYMAKLSDMKSIGEVLLVIAAVGIIGTVLTKLSGMIGVIPITTVLKGIADVAIAMVAFGALAAAIMWLAPYIAALSDVRTTLTVLLMIAAVGIIGSALAALAGLIGLIPITVVLTGLADIALVLGGFTAVIVAFAALTQIDGFTEFLKTGGETLVLICNILGKMVGAAIGGFGEGVTESLPAIGENLSGFATSIKPMFDTFGAVDTQGLTDFVGAFASFIAVVAGEKLLSVITGGIDYAALGKNLTRFATNVSGFFNKISKFDDAAFPKATALFDCLANISSLPKEGGVVGWFQGEVDYTKMADGLNALAGTTGFFTAFEKISEAAFSNASKLFETLAGVKALPNEGGVVGWFMGEIDYAKISAGLNQLAGTTAFFTAVEGISEAGFANATRLFNCLAGVKALPNEGGIVSWFTGDIAYDSVVSGLTSLKGTTSFFKTVEGISEAGFTNATKLFDCLAGVKGLPSEGGIVSWFTGTIAYDSVISGMQKLSSKILIEAINTIATIPEASLTGLSTFFTALSGIGGLPNTGGIVSWFNGDIEYWKISSGLQKLAETASFFTMVEKISETAFTNATKLFDCLAGVKALPQEGGIVSWFTGDIDYSGIATGLNQLAGTTGFFTAVEGISETSFTNATKLFDCLAGVKSLPSEGGIVSWFTGTIAYDSLASGLETLTSEKMLNAFTTISTIPETAFTGLTSLFSALSGVSALPQDGGIFDWFTGDSTTTLTNVASALPGVGKSIHGFFSAVNYRTDFSPIKNLFDVLSNIKINTDVADQGFLSLGKSKLEEIGEGLSAFTNKASAFFSMLYSVNADRVSAFFTLLNNLATTTVKAADYEKLAGIGTKLSAFGADVYKLADAVFRFDPANANSLIAVLDKLGGLNESLIALDANVSSTLFTLGKTLTTRLESMSKALTTTISGMNTNLTNSVSSFTASGEAIMAGLNTGMENKRATLLATAKSIASAIKSTIDEAMDINSPSRVTRKQGAFVGSGLALGMRDAIPDIKGAAFDMSSASMPYSGRYSPEADAASTIYNNGGNSDYTNISPQFNLTISGTQDDRSMARKVKRFVSEAIQETFESLDRKNPVRREV